MRGCVNPDKRSPAPALQAACGCGLKAEGGSLGAFSDSRMAESGKRALKQRATASRAIAPLRCSGAGCGPVRSAPERFLACAAGRRRGRVRRSRGLRDGAAAAEGEAVRRRVADRPLAHVGAQGQHGGRARLFVDIADGRRARRACGAGSARRRGADGAGLTGRGGPRRLEDGAGGLRRRGAARQAQPVHLADHRVAGDPAQLLGDLAGRKAVQPELLERVRRVRRSSPCLASSRLSTPAASRRTPEINILCRARRLAAHQPLLVVNNSLTSHNRRPAFVHRN